MLRDHVRKRNSTAKEESHIHTGGPGSPLLPGSPSWPCCPCCPGNPGSPSGPLSPFCPGNKGQQIFKPFLAVGWSRRKHRTKGKSNDLASVWAGRDSSECLCWLSHIKTTTWKSEGRMTTAKCMESLIWGAPNEGVVSGGADHITAACVVPNMVLHPLAMVKGEQSMAVHLPQSSPIFPEFFFSNWSWEGRASSLSFGKNSELPRGRAVYPQPRKS